MSDATDDQVELARQWAKNHARALAAEADEELEDRITALLAPLRGERRRLPNVRRR